jgi:glycosyltransferase involved in cell wall biosynthesis
MKADIGSWPRLISVIMPAYNHNHYIEEALESVRAQGLEELELIVVDDGSDTPVEPVVRAKIPGATVVRQANAGPSAARNAGIARARGRFVAFLDADDVWTTTALQRLLKGFADAPGAAIVQGSLRRFVTPGNAPSTDATWVGPPFQSFNVGALLVRREVLRDAGPFDESVRRTEDVDLFIRWMERGTQRLVIPHVVLRHRKYHTDRAHGPATIGRWIECLHRSMARRRAAATPARRGGAAAQAVSAILTVRNGMPYLHDALAAIRRQTLLPHEILAVVGPSYDGTLKYLRSEPGIRVIEQSGTGLAAARNAALEKVKCPLIAFCDHDDLWHPAKLEKQVAVLSQFSAPGSCIVNFEEFSEPGGAVPVTSVFRDVPTPAWTPSALLAHRDVFMSVGPFDPALGLGCDADWFRRLRQSNVPCGVAGRVLLYKRRHASNLSREPQSNRSAMFKVLRKARSELMHDVSRVASVAFRDRQDPHR